MAKSRVRLVNANTQPKTYKNSTRLVNLSGYQSPEIVEDDRKDWGIILDGR